MLIPLFAILQLTTTSPLPACIDPAASLRYLAGYIPKEQLAAAGTQRMASAFTKYLETGSRPAYRTAQVRYQATGMGRYDHAARALVLGLIYASGPDLNPAGSAGYRHRLIERDAKAAGIAADHLEAAASLDSVAWLPGVALAHLALAAREPGRTADAFAALRRTLRQDPGSVVVRTAIADLLIATDSATTAIALLDGHTDGCAGADAALAEALLLVGDTARGAPLLLGALERTPPEQLDRFIEDIAVLIGPQERAAFAAVPAAARGAWLRDFWERSAAASARSVAARLSAHVERIARAHRDYRTQTFRTSSLAVKDTRGQEAAARAGDPGGYAEAREGVAAQEALPWDARGLIHVRHGEPDTVIRSLAGSQIYLPTNETWVYARAMPPWLVHFGRYEGPDWFLLGPWVGCGDAEPPATAGSNVGLGVRLGDRAIDQGGVAAASLARVTADLAHAGARGDSPGAVFARDYYLDRAQFDEAYRVLAVHCAAKATAGRSVLAVATQVKQLSQDYDDVVSSMLTTESARRRLERPLRLQVGSYAFRDAASRIELTSFAWLPAADVERLADDAALQLNFALIGTSGAPVRLDTTTLIRGGIERDGAVLRVAVRWPGEVPAGARLHVFAGDARDPLRGGYADQPLPSVDERAAQALSSIVVAVPDEAGPLVRGSYRIAPQPGHVVTVGDNFRLFFELYGVRAADAVETTISIQRARGGDLDGLLARYSDKRAERELRFREPASLDARGVAVRDVAIGGDLIPGDYAIEVRVRTPGAQLRGNAALRIREP